MNGKLFNPMWIMVVVLCVLPTKSSFGQAGPGRGYAKIPKGAYSVVAEVRAKPGRAVNVLLMVRAHCFNE